MSGSPKTMNRLPEPVFLSSSSPIARSGFMRACRMVSRPRVEASSPASGSKAKPHTTSRSAIFTASLAASRMSSGPTVPNSGPIATATVLLWPFSVYSPTAWTYTPGYGSSRLNSRRSARFVFCTPARRRLSRMLVTNWPGSGISRGGSAASSSGLTSLGSFSLSPRCVDPNLSLKST
jgi:hypothetical protein